MQLATLPMPGMARTPQPLAIISRGNVILGTGFSGYGGTILLPNSLIDNTVVDGYYYMFYGTDTRYGLARASSWANVLAGNFTDLGKPTGFPSFGSVPQGRLLLTPDNKWSAYLVTAIGSGTIELYQTAANAAITSTYSQTSSALISLGVGGEFDHYRISEPNVICDQSGVWRLLYMGQSVAGGAEQVGMAVSSGDHTGPYTKAAGNPVIPSGANLDAGIAADSIPVYVPNLGLYLIFCYAGPSSTQAGDDHAIMQVVSTPDWTTFTKAGLLFPPAGAWTSQAGGPVDAYHAGWGDIWWPGKDHHRSLPVSASSLWWHYGARPWFSGANIQGCLAQIDSQSILGGNVISNPWTRVEAESNPSGQVKTGSWTTITNNARGYSNRGFVYSTTAANSIAFTKTCKRIRVNVVEGTAYGICNVFLDSVQVGTYDGDYSGANETLNGVTIGWDTGDMMFGSHTLKLVVSGNKDSSASNIAVGVDCWEYI